MSRQLLILRHGKSSWDSDAATDFDRPLAKRGRKDATRIGRWLAEQGLVPDHVVSSPAKRARQTTVRVARELDLRKSRLDWEPRIYEADTAALLAVLAECPVTAATVLLIGHNPGLEALLSHLCGARVQAGEDGKLLPTATLARLAMPAVWTRLEPGTARLLAMIRPKSLPGA